MKNVFFVTSLIILFFILVSCTMQNKTMAKNVDLINKINSKYCNLTTQNIESMDFLYKSSKFDSLQYQIKNKTLAKLINDIEYIVQWKNGSDVAILTRNVPRLKNSDAKLGLDKILSGTKTEIKGLFLIMTPALGNLITYNRSVDVVSKEIADGYMLEFKRKFRPAREILYFDKDFKLLKAEIYEGNKLIAINTMVFDVYMGKYLLKQIDTELVSNRNLKTSVEIRYVDINGKYLPSNIALSAARDNRQTKYSVTLMPLEK